MMIHPGMSLRELAFVVCTALHDAGCSAVLTGGGAATVYAPNSYQSRDLDFVFEFWSSIGNPSEASLANLGFFRQGSAYAHPDTHYTLDFPPGPLAVGEEQILTWDTLTEGDQILRILTPTDSVRDRLAWLIHGRDYSALEQALAVALLHPIDLDRIRLWCADEGGSDLFELFRQRLEVLRQSP